MNESQATKSYLARAIMTFFKATLQHWIKLLLSRNATMAFARFARPMQKVSNIVGLGQVIVVLVGN